MIDGRVEAATVLGSSKPIAFSSRGERDLAATKACLMALNSPGCLRDIGLNEIGENDREGGIEHRSLSREDEPSSAAPKVIDLCCGLGGLSLAAHQLGMKILAGVDTGEDAIKTFSKNFPNAAAIKTTVGGRKAITQCQAVLPKKRTEQAPLIVISGPPCQGFSAAGTRDPKDRRNKVLLGVARAIGLLQPNFALDGVLHF